MSKGQDVLKNLEGTLFYYEKIATKDGGPDRLMHLNGMVQKMRQVIAKVKSEIQGEDPRSGVNTELNYFLLYKQLLTTKSRI